jgi:biopolymer transport protein TolR
MSDINVTPLVDVMLVLLVVFMVTAPLLVQSIPVELPRTTARRPAPAPHLSLSIDRTGRVYLERQPVALSALPDALHTQGGAAPDVILEADRNVPFGSVAQVLALVQSAGIGNLSIVTLAP